MTDREPLSDRLDAVRFNVPTRGNRKLERFVERASSDPQVRAWWHLQQVGSERLGMSDHSWVHIQIVANIALRMLRLAYRAGIEPAMVSDHGMRENDAEVVVTAGAMLHDTGMSIHRADHEAYSLFLAEPKLRALLDGIYEEPELTVVVSESLHCIIGHRRRGEPYTVEAGSRRAWSASPTPSTWPRAGPACPSSAATSASTRSRRRRSTTSRSSAVPTVRSGSRSR
jgi:metal-dependent HD superfamily phosphatase/phosphodiesterase